MLDFEEIDQTQIAIAGGKGAHLGELSRIEGIDVPAGFCVTTNAFERIMAEAPSIDDRLSRPMTDDRDAIRTLSAEIRETIEQIAVPGDGLGDHLLPRSARRPSRLRRAIECDRRGLADGQRIRVNGTDGYVEILFWRDDRN